MLQISSLTGEQHMIDPRKFQWLAAHVVPSSLSWASINLAERRFTTEAELHFILHTSIIVFSSFYQKKQNTKKKTSGHWTWTPNRQAKLHVCHDKDVQLKTCVHMQLLPAVKLLTYNLWLSADHNFCSHANPVTTGVNLRHQSHVSWRRLVRHILSADYHQTKISSAVSTDQSPEALKYNCSEFFVYFLNYWMQGKWRAHQNN